MGSAKRCEACGNRRGWRRVDGKRRACRSCGYLPEALRKAAKASRTVA